MKFEQIIQFLLRNN